MKHSWGQTLNTNGPQRLQRFTCKFCFRPSHLDNGSDVDCSKLFWPGAAPSEQLTSLEALAGHILSNVPGEGAFFLVIKNKIYLTIQKVVRYQHSWSVTLRSSLKNLSIILETFSGCYFLRFFASRSLLIWNMSKQKVKWVCYDEFLL